MLNEIFNKVRDALSEQFNDKDVSVKCPNCGAQNQTKQSRKTFVCQYCGSENENPDYKNLFDLQQTEEDEDFDDNYDDNFDADFESENEVVYDGNAMYAYIEKSTLFYNGEIPGVTFGKANLCTSYEECVAKLRSIAKEERNKAFFKKPQQSLSAIKKQHPNAKIIKL